MPNFNEIPNYSSYILINRKDFIYSFIHSSFFFKMKTLYLITVHELDKTSGA